ncbi:MAG: MFS transporter, partial [Halobacteriales archaeon]|nr:MFS transporter [Halobacteriales archaeon]
MSDTTPTVTIRSYVLLALGSLGYFGFLFVWFVLPAFLSPVIQELGISNTKAGLLTGAIPLIYIPLSLTSGLVVDRIGSRRAIGIGLILLGIAGGIRGMAPGFPSMLALTLLVGVGGTGITFGLPKLVSDLFPPERSGTMSSVYLIGSYLGTAAAFGFGRPYLG